MNLQVCGRKKYMMDVVFKRQPVQFCKNGRDVVSFHTVRDSSSYYVLCCL